MSVVFNLRKQGDYCLKGDKGDTGATGPQGPQGPRGERGLQGIQGIQGIRGLTGERGEQGPQGLTGPRGLQGETGATGPQGPIGPKGDKGDPGNSENSLSKKGVIYFSDLNKVLEIGMYTVIPNTKDIKSNPMENEYFQCMVVGGFNRDYFTQYLISNNSEMFYRRAINDGADPEGVTFGIWKKVVTDDMVNKTASPNSIVQRDEFSNICGNTCIAWQGAENMREGSMSVVMRDDSTGAMFFVNNMSEMRNKINVPSNTDFNVVKQNADPTLTEVHIGSLGSGVSIKATKNTIFSISGDEVVEISNIDTTDLKNGDEIYFCCFTTSNTANIKFNRTGSGFITPKGQDFWITGSDNGDVIFTFKFFGGTLRLVQ